MDARLTKALSVRVEYLFFKFAKQSFFNPPPPVLADRAGGLDPELHVLRLGLSLNF